ncbi:MAG: ATP-binding cassette domain-containing protein [Candidatus Limivicinus sp.]
MFEDAFRKLAGVVTGEKRDSLSASERLRMLFALEDLGKGLNITVPYNPNAELNEEWYREQYFRPQGIMWRPVRLKDRWYEDAVGVMMATFEDGSPVALLPAWNRGCYYRDPDTGRKIRVTEEVAGRFRPEATLYYRPLPARKIGDRDLWEYIRDSVSPAELMWLLCTTVGALLLSMVTPAMTKLLTSHVAELGDLQMLYVVLAVLLLVTGAAFLVTAMKQLVLSRIGTKVAVPLQAAFMMRILSAPAGQLRDFSAGDLGSRVGVMYSSLKTLLDMFLSIMLTAACSFICFPQMFHYAPGPAMIALLVTLALIILYALVIRTRFHVSEDRMRFQAQESGLTYNLIEGMQKIILSGAEKRAFSVWARVYRRSIRTIYDPPMLLKIFGVLTPVILLAGTIGIYPTAVHGGLSQSSFYAFLSSYAILTGALTMISTNAVNFADALPVFRMMKPVMDMAPEVGEQKEVVEKLRGNIALRDISFRYDDGSPNILENLNIEIHSGEYVALVGATGSGKSTILRLLLGFETPDHGEVLYDGKNLNTLDVTSVRRKIGTVLQDGEVLRGTILSNITVSDAGLTEEDAWAAAEIAGIAEDIRRMPMKMYTPLPDNGQGVSGGQKQRLLIARAVAAKPAVLYFDEATSALDNVTQKAVSDAIGEMACTRFVIAHRLSTVQNCDRILCLDQGHIVEEGSYEELMQKQGFFAELVKRQQI